MIFRYQVLEKLLSSNPKRSYPEFNCSEFIAQFPGKSPELVMSAIYDLQSEGLLDFTHQRNDKLYAFRISPVSLSHLYTLDEIAHIKRKEIWLNRLYGFISGVVTTVLANFIAKWLSI